MHKVNLASVDLNLLVALQALLDEKNVTRAAAKVGLSQPAMSRALGRLRDLFDDQLLVRTSKGMSPTPRGSALAEPLGKVLSGVDQMIQPPEFDPKTVEGRRRIATTGYGSLIMLPQVIGRFFHEAPNLNVDILNIRTESVVDLETGAIDLAIGGLGVSNMPAGFFQQNLFDDRFVCLVRAGHPALGDDGDTPLNLESYVRHPHGLLTVTGDGPGVIDDVLKRIGVKRRIALRLPHPLVAPIAAAESDLIFTLPKLLADRIQMVAPVVVIEPPEEISREIGMFSVRQHWHERHHHDPGHIWMRNLLAECVRGQ
jgi:DNA-binding transcriptional LysR family regulator